MPKVVEQQENMIFGLTGRELVRKPLKGVKHKCNFCDKTIRWNQEYLKTYSRTRNIRYYHYSCVLSELSKNRIKIKQGDTGLQTKMDMRPSLYTPRPGGVNRPSAG